MPNDMKIKAILAKNVSALKVQTPALNSDAKIAKKCRELGYNVSARAVSYMLDVEEPRQPAIDTVEAVGKAFKVPAWMLLSPEFDAANRKIKDLPPPEVIALAERLNANKDLLHDVFGLAAVSDEEMEENGWKAPVAADAPPAADVKKKKPPRQLAMKLKR